jgi:predicted transcriptional regulator
MMRSPNKDKRG